VGGTGPPRRGYLQVREGGHCNYPVLVTGRFPAAVLARQFPAQAWGLLQGRTHLALALRLTEADLGGSVAALDLRPWLDWWADHKGPGTGDSGGGATLRSAQVRVGRLSLPATTLKRSASSSTTRAAARQRSSTPGSSRARLPCPAVPAADRSGSGWRGWI